MFMPFNILGMWLKGLITLLLLGGSVYLLTRWYDYRDRIVSEPSLLLRSDERVDDDQPVLENSRVVHWQFGFNEATALLLGGLALLAISIGGRWFFSPQLFRKRGADEPGKLPAEDGQFVRLPDGSNLWMTASGPVNGVPVILTHGWGLDASEWYYTRKFLSQKYRVIVWDLPGLGHSDSPPSRDWSVEQLAHSLHAIISASGTKPAVLMGHSIGVMTTLTYCKLYPESLGSRIRGLVLAQGTYTNPVKTTARSSLYSALQKPLLEPLCHITVWLSPIFRLLNILSYFNGSAHRSTERDSFSGHETRGQLDHLARSYCKAAPSVVARGMLGMMKYDATAVLARIPIPVLVVAGDNDQTCLAEASRFMAKQIPDATLAILTDSKHCGFFEHSEAFHAPLAPFLASVCQGEATSSGRRE